MQFTIRSKLITGYITLLVSVTIAAIYGYYSLAKVVEGKKNIQFFTNSVILSNSIYQYMSEARQDQNLFIQSMNLDLAIAVTAKVALLREKALELEGLGRKIKDFDQIEMSRAINESAVVYLETFQSLVDSVTRRDLVFDGSVRGQLVELRSNLEKEFPIELILKMRLLENSQDLELSDILPQKSKSNYFVEFFEYARETGNPDVLEKLRAYQDNLVRLYFENANIDDLTPLMQINAEMIELLVVDNVDTAQQELKRQFAITERLEQRQKILSLLVTAITISAGLLVVFVFGAEALDLSKLNLELAAILEAIRDGIVAVNREAKVTLINQRAKDLLGLRKDYLGKHILELFPNSKLPEVMKSGEAHYDQEQQRGKITVLTTRIPVMYRNDTIGGIVCFRKKEELSRLASELTHVNTYIDALRANNHEFKNRLQTIQGMVQLGKTEEVLSFIQSLQVSHEQRISLYLENIGDPAVSAILLGKFNRANELGISLSLAEESQLTVLPDYIDRNGIVSIIGNLVQNAMDAVRELKRSDKEIRVAVKEYPDSFYFSVEDNGPGISHSISGRIFEQGFTTKKGQYAVDTSELGELGEKHIGMGLYITKNHIISMGGMIQYKCENGTMFEVTIPKQPE
ncbi:MAG: ATP-binding protein [Proteobacteria bacterium]|nr:ATP-binding protein [Pseudomonadota bacterium]